MSVNSLLSYYPTYQILDEVLSNPKYDTLNLYIDLKNNLQSLYMQHAIVNIIENTLGSKYTDTSVFSSLMAFLAFHKMYSVRRENLKINYFIFFESGRSYFHENVSKKYKVNRKIDDLYGLDKDKRDLFFEVLQKNFTLIEKSCNKIPNIKVIRLNHLEADFIPYYLITRNLVPRTENVAHMIYSNDHDLLQCIVDENIYVFQKNQSGKKIIKKDEVLKTYPKFSKFYSDEYLPLIMAIIGDTGDSVDGIKGIGPSRVEAMMDELISLTGGMKTIFENVMNGNPIFPSSSSTNPNKYTQLIIEKELNEKFISKNLHLVSFEVLSRYMDIPHNTEMIEKKNHVNEILNSNILVPLEPMRNALEKVGVYFANEELDTIYHGSII